MLALRDDIDSITQWLNLNKLTLNTKKTKFMLFGTRNKLKHAGNLPIIINGDVIEQVHEFKYLGVILDEYLNFESHVKYIYSKASRKIGAIRKVREHVGEGTALRLYKSLVLPHFDYCDTVYMTASMETLNRLQLLQNHACRTMLMANREAHIADMHKDLGLLTLTERRQLHFGFQIHKTMYEDCNVSLKRFFVSVTSGRVRPIRGNHRYDMVVPRVRSSMGEKAIAYRGPSFWNFLPVDVKCVTVFSSFKRVLSTMVHELFGDHPT